MMRIRHFRRTHKFLLLTLALGLLSRLCRTGWYLLDKSLGDILYGTAAYLTLALIFDFSIKRNYLLACLACWVVETFKLTGLPAAYGHIPIVPWVFGRVFSWHNVACYPIGAALGALVDAMVLGPRKTRLWPPGEWKQHLSQMDRVMLARQRQTRIADAEASEVRDGKPFGDLHENWKAFVEGIKPGDKLWLFRTAEETWVGTSPRGMMGYVIVRGDQPVEAFFTKVQ